MKQKAILCKSTRYVADPKERYDVVMSFVEKALMALRVCVVVAIMGGVIVSAVLYI